MLAIPREATPQAVGIGERVVSQAPARLSVHGLGSCIAIFLHDPTTKIGGLAHALLPGDPFRAGGIRAGFYTLPAIRCLVSELEAAGARREALSAKLAGGARLLRGEGWDDAVDGVGSRNVIQAIECLRGLGLPLAGCDTGGSAGRSLLADLDDGSVQVRSPGSVIKIL